MMKKYVKCSEWVYITFTMFTESIYFHKAEKEDRKMGRVVCDYFDGNVCM